MINQFDNLELVTMVNPTCQLENGKSVFQFLYASQLYGTTFAVYGRFNHAPMAAGDNECKLQSLELKLLNYRGVINLGFVEERPTHRVDEANPDQYIIEFKVQAFKPGRDQKVDFNQAISIPKGKNVRFTFNRILLPMEGFEDGSNNANDVNVVMNTTDDRLNKGYFDTEFMDRSGTEYYYQPLVPGLENSRMSNQGTNNNKEVNRALIVSHRCHQSNVNLYF
jgi:hypothetical protein